MRSPILQKRRRCKAEAVNSISLAEGLQILAELICRCDDGNKVTTIHIHIHVNGCVWLCGVPRPTAYRIAVGKVMKAFVGGTGTVDTSWSIAQIDVGAANFDPD